MTPSGVACGQHTGNRPLVWVRMRLRRYFPAVLWRVLCNVVSIGLRHLSLRTIDARPMMRA